MYRTHIPADRVRSLLSKHMLADGFEQVLDLERSRGSWIVDARDGREYVDLFTFFASMPLGLNHPRLASGDGRDYLQRVAVNKPTSSDFYTTPMAEFVETFARIGMPSYLPYLFLVEGGSVAVENLLKMAFDWKVRMNFAKGIREERGHRIIHFRQCFHGRTGYTLSMTDSHDARKTSYYPKFDWPRVTNPKILFPLDERSLADVRRREEQAVREIREALAEHPGDVAALIIEPIQGEGGDNHFRPEFFQTLRALADENEFLLLADEVQTGMGLTGTFWAHTQMGVEVDGLAFGKKMQVCGILGGRRLDLVEDHVFRVPSRINSTWGGNLVDMARSRLYLEILEQENVLAHVRGEGEHLLARLHAIAEHTNGAISNVRGRGLMCAFDLADGAVRKAVLDAALEEGVFILGCGERSIRFRPALNIPRAVLDEGVDRIARAIRRAAVPAPGAKARA